MLHNKGALNYLGERVAKISLGKCLGIEMQGQEGVNLGKVVRIDLVRRRRTKTTGAKNEGWRVLSREGDWCLPNFTSQYIYELVDFPLSLC